MRPGCSCDQCFLVSFSDLTDWLSCGFTSNLTQNRSFRRHSQSQSLGLVWKKLNLTRQKHTFTNQKKRKTTQNKHKRTKARFNHLLWHTIRKRIQLIRFRRFINLSLTFKTLTHLLTAPGPTQGPLVLWHCWLGDRTVKIHATYSQNKGPAYSGPIGWGLFIAGPLR